MKYISKILLVIFAINIASLSSSATQFDITAEHRTNCSGRVFPSGTHTHDSGDVVVLTAT
jgi:hypothetical protein